MTPDSEMLRFFFLMISVFYSGGCQAQTVLAAHPISPEESLFNTYFEPVPRKAMDAYPSSFMISAPDFTEYQKDSARLYRAIGCIVAGDIHQAVKLLSAQAIHRKGVISNASEWYLALAYLRQGSIERAVYLFHKIAETEVHPYQNEAEMAYQALLRRSEK